MQNYVISQDKDVANWTLEDFGTLSHKSATHFFSLSRDKGEWDSLIWSSSITLVYTRSCCMEDLL